MDNSELLKKLSGRLFIVVFCIGLFFLGFILGNRSDVNLSDGHNAVQYRLSGNLSPAEEIKNINFNTFWSVWNYLETKYIDKNIDKESMFNGAVKGMVSGLDDPVTLFLTKEETENYEKVSSGEFSGIGAELGYEGGMVVIKSLLPDTPASRSELKAGDVILEVNGENVEEKSALEIMLKIHGEAGTEVSIKVYRSSEGKDFTIRIIRAKIDIDNVTYSELEDGVIQLRVSRFTEGSLDEFIKVWNKVIDEIVQRNPRGLIIDLRGNPGGYLDGAVYAAGDFVDKGSVILYTQDRDGNLSSKKSEISPRFHDTPVIILVDSDSASASEIFAGALQYYDRARIIGERTFGKGTAQEVIKSEEWEGASLHITVQKWLLPNKIWLNNDNPIVPDIEVSNTVDGIKQGEDLQLEKAVEELLE